jgi:hypothetical protein
MAGLGDRIRTAGQQISAAGPAAIPGWMMIAGIGSWLVAGMAVVLALAGWFFVTTASISVPLVLAAVVGMIAYPLAGLRRHHVATAGHPRAPGHGRLHPHG